MKAQIAAVPGLPEKPEKPSVLNGGNIGRPLCGAHNTAKLDQMVREFREIDEVEADRIRQRNEDVYLEGIRAWFRRTDPKASA